ncbi:uncharacterized protein LOC142219433 [Haematobia irritans]|uniref:uncharacterized protein LOC142219433 n=1 Tax=Haematobia irritans TaxID=7368 RepID=UPI003F509CA1
MCKMPINVAYKLLFLKIAFIAYVILPRISALCIYNERSVCLTEMSSEEANETLAYVLSKYEGVEMKIIGEPISIYGLRLSHDDSEEEINIHFKYMDNTQHDIIQNCMFALYRRQNECELIRTICNTFLPITPRPLLARNDLRVCDDGNDVQLIEKEDIEEDTEESSTMTITDAEQVVVNADADADDGQESR